jgi:hypothetical protein
MIVCNYEKSRTRLGARDQRFILASKLFVNCRCVLIFRLLSQFALVRRASAIISNIIIPQHQLAPEFSGSSTGLSSHRRAEEVSAVIQRR